MKEIILQEKETSLQNPKPYHAPRLDELGAARAVTLGGSPGIGDSGGLPGKPLGM